MHTPPSGAQMPQLSLQQYSPEAQTFIPHGSPWGMSGGQYSRVHPWPSATQRLQLSLQQYSPGPQMASLQGVYPQASLQETVSGMQARPHSEQQCVPARQRTVAHTSLIRRTQMPKQSAPVLGVAIVARVVDADEAFGTRETGDAAALQARTPRIVLTIPFAPGLAFALARRGLLGFDEQRKQRRAEQTSLTPVNPARSETS